MKKFMCVILAIVLVVMCGCSVARLCLEMAKTQTNNVVTPVYTYEHIAYGAMILESNTYTGEVEYIPVCPQCGYSNPYGSPDSATIIDSDTSVVSSKWCAKCQEDHPVRIGVKIYIEN